MNVSEILTTDIIPKRWRRNLPPGPRGCRRAYAVINDATLPPEPDAWVRTLVKGLKLWPAEREDIARELVNHIQEALDAGADPAELTKQLGDTRTTARMMRRAAKRKRPLPWRMLRNVRRTALATLVLFVVLYAASTVRFLMGSPEVKTDYLAMLNADARACAEEDRAWPAYKDTHLAWQLHIYDEEGRQRERAEALKARRSALFDDDREDEIEKTLTEAGIDLIRFGEDLPPDHPDHDATIELVRSFEPQLAQLRAASTRPCFGAIVSDRTEETRINDRIVDRTVLPPTPNLEDREPVIGILLPYLGDCRGLTQLLRFDAKLAATDADPGRVSGDLHAILGMAEHLSQSSGFVINDLVVIAIISTVIYDLPRHYLGPDKLLMNDTQLRSLKTRLGQLYPTITIHTEGERMMFDDILQRAYTDDGRGNGRITPEGINMLYQVSGRTQHRYDVDWSDNAIVAAAGPVALTVVGDRASQRRIYHDAMDTTERVLHKGPSAMHELYQLEHELASLETGIIGSPAELLTPALTRAVERVFITRMETETAILALDLELHRLEHGVYPESLDELDCGSPPEDLFNPGNPIRYTRDPDALGYTLYSLGEDGDDDNATTVNYSFGDQRPHQLGRAVRRGPPAEYPRDSEVMYYMEQAKEVLDADWVLIRVGDDEDDAS